MEVKKATKANRSTMTVSCSDCDFSTTFAPDHDGATYFQTYGDCPLCGAETIYPDGKPTKLKPRGSLSLEAVLIVAGLGLATGIGVYIVFKTIISFFNH